MPEIRDRIRELRRVPARDLQANPRNWRTHPKAQTSALMGMLQEIGLADAAIAYEREDGKLELIDGHARQGVVDPGQLIPVLILDVSQAEADKLLLTMDTLTTMAGADRELLVKLRDSVDFDDQRTSTLLDAINRDYSLNALVASASTKGGETPPENVEPRTKRGDIWQCGDHRIMCGDATAPADYRALMGGDGASLVFTDPPYGVSYAAAGFEAIRNDEKQRAELTGFLALAFREITKTLLPNAAVYIWHASATRREFETAMYQAGLVELQYIVWVKPTLVLGHADYQWQHEPCFYAAKAGEHPAFYGARSETTAWYVTPWTDYQAPVVSIAGGLHLTSDAGASIYLQAEPPKGKKPRWMALEAGQRIAVADDRSDTDVWSISRDTAKPEHPTQKPVALAGRAIVNSSLAGQVVLDPFIGSGSTLIAAERAGRRCFGMDLEPGYVDVTVARWELETGRKAELATRGPTGE